MGTAEIQKNLKRILWTIMCQGFDNLEEMNDFLETYSPPILNQEETIDPKLLWHRPAAVASIQPLAWELPYTADAAMKNK